MPSSTITPLKDLREITIASIITRALPTLVVEAHKDLPLTQDLEHHGLRAILVPDHQRLTPASSQRPHIKAHQEGIQALKVHLAVIPDLKVHRVAIRDHKVRPVATLDHRVHREAIQALKVRQEATQALKVPPETTQDLVVVHKDLPVVQVALGPTTQARVHLILDLLQAAKAIHQADPVGLASILQAVGEDQLSSPTENISHLGINYASI